jgi:hypothetical protein
MATKKKTAKKATPKKTAKNEAAEAKPAAKKAPAKKAPAKKATTRRTATRQKSADVIVSPEDFYKMVQEAAYFQAEKDGFANDPSAYWLEAEKEIEKRLSGE